MSKARDLLNKSGVGSFSKPAAPKTFVTNPDPLAPADAHAKPDTHAKGKPQGKAGGPSGGGGGGGTIPTGVRPKV